MRPCLPGQIGQRRGFTTRGRALPADVAEREPVPDEDLQRSHNLPHGDAGRLGDLGRRARPVEEPGYRKACLAGGSENRIPDFPRQVP
jgi:hypothetical protein